MDLTRRDFSALMGMLTLGGTVPAGGWAPLADGRAGERAKENSIVHATPEEIWADLMEGNRRFVVGEPAVREFLHKREELVAGQHPPVIVLGCADSRVCPSLIFDKNLGDLFVVRTAGNITDAVALGSIEYAVEHLHARVLLVLGHEKCGAVAATAAGGKMPTASLEAIAQKISPALDKVKGRAEGEPLLRLAEEANVHQSVNDILRESPVVRGEVEAGRLAIVKALYHLGTGEVARLQG